MPLDDSISSLLHGRNRSPWFEAKIEITEQCGLRCSFCHQGFSENPSPRSMPLDQFEKLLRSLAADEISTIRFTGGEPLMHPDIRRMVEKASEQGFAIILNTNAVLWEEKGLQDILPHLQCIKISLPAPDENGTRALTGVPKAFVKKLEAAAMAIEAGIDVEFLTPMFPEAISNFSKFLPLLECLPDAKWLPLRAEPTPHDHEPVSRREMLYLISMLQDLDPDPFWSGLRLYLSVPFCIMRNLGEAARFLDGRLSCGPIAGFAMDAEGTAMRCYSRRMPVPMDKGFHSAMYKAACRDIEALPSLCRKCPALALCLGGCRCPHALTPGGFDYLAEPDHARQWIADGLSPLTLEE